MIPDYVLDRAGKSQDAVKSKLIRDLRAREAEKRTQDAEPDSMADIAIHDVRNGTKLPGELVYEDEDLPDKSNDIAVNQAFDGLIDTFDYFELEHNRMSIDGNGMQLVGCVHYDRNFDNAFWDGQRMVFGDGEIFNPFTSDLTVIAHELTHGVTERTSNFTYFGQSGALNEHISDAFGSLVLQHTLDQTPNEASWLIGAELLKGKVQGRALRDMLNPGTAYDDPRIGKDPQPSHMSDLYTGYEDNGGVHINSGIPNRAFALACLKVGDMACETIGLVWYAVLTKGGLPRNASFAQFASKTLEMAGEWKDAIADAWNTVGVVPGEAPVPVPSSPCLPFIDQILADDALVTQIRTLAKHPLIRRGLLRLMRGE